VGLNTNHQELSKMTAQTITGTSTGKIKAKVPIDGKAWNDGYQAALNGQSSFINPYVSDNLLSLAWISGFIEGKAKRAMP
jgi:ribosome modulation factor